MQTISRTYKSLNNRPLYCPFFAAISVHGKRIHLGRYHRLEDAVKARQRGEDEYFLPLIEQKAAEEVAE